MLAGHDVNLVQYAASAATCCDGVSNPLTFNGTVLGLRGTALARDWADPTPGHEDAACNAAQPPCRPVTFVRADTSCGGRTGCWRFLSKDPATGLFAVDTTLSGFQEGCVTTQAQPLTPPSCPPGSRRVTHFQLTINYDKRLQEHPELIPPGLPTGGRTGYSGLAARLWKDCGSNPLCARRPLGSTFGLAGAHSDRRYFPRTGGLLYARVCTPLNGRYVGERAMRLRLFRKRRAIGLDIGSGSVKALCLERRGEEVVVTGRALRPVDPDADPRQLAQAIHTVLATAGGAGEPVVAAVGGPDVVIRQVALPPLPNQKILPALELQHRELGLLPPGDAVLDAQVLRRAHDGVSNDVLSVSVPRARIDERMRLLELAAVDVQILDVEPLALLNGAMHLTALDHGELLVLLTVGRLRSVLCLYSEQGPVVARYLSAGAETLLDQLRMSFDWNEDAVQAHTRVLSPAQVPRAEAACRDIIERIAEDVRLSLTFYRTEYDRESLPRYAIGGSLDLPYLGRWLADRLGLTAPLELMDPFKAVEIDARQAGDDLGASGPRFLQAFGLALRGL